VITERVLHTVAQYRLAKNETPRADCSLLELVIRG